MYSCLLFDLTMSSASSPTRRVKTRKQAVPENESSRPLTASLTSRNPTSATPTGARSARDGSLKDSGYNHGIYSQSRPMQVSSVPQRSQQLPRQTMQYDVGAAPHLQNYPQFLSFVETLTLQLGFLWAGLRDSFRWDLLVKLLLS